MLRELKELPKSQRIFQILNQNDGVGIRKFQSTKLRYEPNYSLAFRERHGPTVQPVESKQKLRTFWNKPSQTNFNAKEQFWARQYRRKQKFCGDIVVKKQTRPVFKRIVTQYKRHFHPANASKSEKDMSEDGSREPKKSVQFREKMRQSELIIELRRLTILSKVISENNRRKTRMIRQKSIMQSKTMA